MEKSLSKNSSNQSINKVREELFGGLKNKQWHVIIQLKECYPITCSSSQGRSGPGDLAYFLSGKVASLSEFYSKDTIKINSNARNIFHPLSLKFQ